MLYVLPIGLATCFVAGCSARWVSGLATGCLVASLIQDYVVLAIAWNELGALVLSWPRCGSSTAAQPCRARAGRARLAVDQLRHGERLKMIGALAAGVAHELGTPLNVIAGPRR